MKSFLILPHAHTQPNVSLAPPPGHVPWRHFNLQNLPAMELRRSLATSNIDAIEDEDAGCGLLLLEAVPAYAVLTW
jgi:hypothetical protein